MKTYRCKLTPKGSFITPIQADTLFGHLCWIIKWRKEEKALTDFLQAFETDPPFILSDGFPGDLLPAPFHLPTLARETDDRKRFREHKALKKLEWLYPDEFRAAQRGELKLEDKERAGFRPVTTLHSSINRITGTTGEEGSLFELEAHTLDKGREYISVYVKIKEGGQYGIEYLNELFKDLSITGYGKKKSVGKGSFDISPIEELPDNMKCLFENTKEANGFVCLSNFVPAQNDPTDGCYKAFVKYGKLGGEYAFSGKPFKKPLMMVKAGSVFKCDTLKPFYGRMVRDLLLEMPDVVQYGYGFPARVVVP